MIEAVGTSETSVNFYEVKRRNVPENGHRDEDNYARGMGKTIYEMKLKSLNIVCPWSTGEIQKH
jgi:hypothetical protein